MQPRYECTESETGVHDWQLHGKGGEVCGACGSTRMATGAKIPVRAQDHQRPSGRYGWGGGAVSTARSSKMFGG